MKKFIFLTLLATLFSCSNTDDDRQEEQVGIYSNGVFILNEGNFGTPNATVSFISTDFSSVYQDIFSSANAGAALGDVAQSMDFYNENAFVVMNNSNTVEVVTKKDFKKVFTITEQLANPRRILIENGKIFVTNALDNSVSIYDANTFNFISKVVLDFSPEFLVEEDNFVYVVPNMYDSGTSVAVLNASNNALVKYITIESGVKGIAEANDKIYVLTSNTAATKIFQINTQSNTVATTYTLGNITDANYLEYEDNQLYFTSNTGIYTFDVTANYFESTPIFHVVDNSWSTLYGFSVIDNYIYTSDAKGFNQDGEITIYNKTGAVIKQFKAGIGPNGFFKD